MKILKIDHLGIAVNSIDEGKSLWTDVLGLAFEGSETVEEQKVTTAFFPVGESEVELLESTAPDGPVAKFLEKRGQGFHHVAFRVTDLEEQKYWHQRITSARLPVSSFIDRYYFKSIYFRISNGILFEIATDGPGFDIDEAPEALGEALILPPFLENRREEIEANLTPIGS